MPVNVKSNARLELRTGVYVVDSLSLEPNALLLIDAAAGPVEVYVRQSLIYRGKITIARGGPGDFLLGYVGTSSAFLEAAFTGSVVAPNATLVLASLNVGQHQGSFFGRNIEVHQGSVVRLVPFRWWKRFVTPTCAGLTSAQQSAITPYLARDFFRLCSSGTLPSGQPLSAPAVFGQLRGFEARARSAESAYVAAFEKTIEVDTFLAHPVGLPPGKTIAQADAELSLSSDAVAALIAERDAFMATVVAATTADAASLTTAALASFWSNTRGSMVAWAPSKRFDTSCEELVRNEIGLDLVEALARNDLPLYLTHLGRLQKALSCSSLDAALGFSHAFVLGFDDAVAKFPAALRTGAKHALFASLVNVAIVLHDFTKFAGPTPLYTWLKDHANELSAEIALSTSVLMKTGLWLRHPSGDALVQIPGLCEVSLQGFCVSIGHLLQALTDPSRLGLGVCPAFAMVTEKAIFDPMRGYSCSDFLCEASPGGGAPGPKATSLLPTALVDFSTAAPKTLFGADLATTQVNACQRRPGGGGGAGASIEQAARCVLAGSEAARSSALIACIGEASESSSWRGWPLDTCTDPRGADVGEGAPMSPTTPQTEADKKKFEDAKKLAEQKATEQNTQNLKNGAAASNNAKSSTHYNTSNITTANVLAGVKASVVVDSTSISPKDGSTPVTINTGRGTATPGAPQISDGYIHRSDVSISQLADVILHEANHYALSKAVNKIKDPSTGVLENGQHKIMCPKGGCGQKYCAETGSCGGCSGLSSMFNALKKCGVSLPSGLPPVNPLDLLIYPLEPPGSSNAWTTCLAGLLPTGLGEYPGDLRRAHVSAGGFRLRFLDDVFLWSERRRSSAVPHHAMRRARLCERPACHWSERPLCVRSR